MINYLIDRIHSSNKYPYFAMYIVHFFAQIFDRKIGCVLYMGSTNSTYI